MPGARALGFVLPRFAIHRQGRAWVPAEARERLRRLGDCKIEVRDGRLASAAPGAVTTAAPD